MSVAVGLGLMEFPFSDARAFWRWVDLCEAGGIDSLWQTDRLVSDRPMLEAMSVMAALAGATSRIKFGMNVIALGMRDPLVIAKECATIDMLSEGRLLPAFGVGSPVSPDWDATGRGTAGRGTLTDEALDIITALWRGERVTTRGRHYRYTDAAISPVPVQRRLPVWIGGSSPAAIRRTARIGTGWLGSRETPAEAAGVVRAIREQSTANGRRIPDDHYGTGFFCRLGAPDEPIVVRETARLRRRFPDRDVEQAIFAGDVPALVARLRAYARAGVTKFVLRPVGADDGDLMAQTRRVVEEVLPAVAALNESLAAAAQSATP